MASSQTQFSLLFFTISFFQLSSQQPLCLTSDRLALIQFENSFVIDKNASSYPKFDLWKNQGTNCCSWKGVKCDEQTSHVIGIDISNQRLFGSINSSSSLFRLSRLQYLNLTGNNLDASFFSGSILNHKNRLTFDVPYTMTVTNKGRRMEYRKVLEIFTAMDFSCNKLSGEIPEIVGNLKRLQLLNISNNILYGYVPSVLGYLSNLEALDLSNNKLFGRIPTELTQLTFLAVFNVSNNLLTGPIPRSSQFATFENSSFEGNPGLCGMPLSKKCGNYVPLLPSSSEGNGKISLLSEIGWRAVLIGCGCGFLGGAVLGVKVFARKKEWFLSTFRIRQGRRRSAKR